MYAEALGWEGANGAILFVPQCGSSRATQKNNVGSWEGGGTQTVQGLTGLVRNFLNLKDQEATVLSKKSWH